MLNTNGLKKVFGNLASSLYHKVSVSVSVKHNHAPVYDHKETKKHNENIMKINRKATGKELQQRIGDLVATLYPGIKVYQDRVFGDEAPLILTLDGNVVSADAYEVDDYREWVPFLVNDFAL